MHQCLAVLIGTVFALTLTASTAGARVVSGLAAYWNFEDDVTSNQVSGAADATVLTGSPTTGVMAGASGLFGNAMVLDGKKSPVSSRDSIQLPFGSGPHAGAGDLGTSFTISAWYWQASGPIDRNFVFEAGNAVPANFHVSYGTGGSNSSYTSYIRNTGAGTVVTDFETWHHVLHSFSEADGQTTLRVHIDGRLRDTRTVSAALDVPAINVGTFRSATGRFFHGMIDEVALWDRDLSAHEAYMVYNMGQAGYGLVSHTTQVKANNRQSLHTGASWESGVAPGDSDSIVFNTTFAQPEPLDTGGSLPVGGVQVTDGTRLIHIDNTGPGHYLQVGGLGVDMMMAERDLRIENLRLGASQIWNIAEGRTFTVGAASELSGNHSITKRGEGTAVVSGTNTYTGGTTLSAGTLQVGGDNALGSGDLILNGGTLSSDAPAARTLTNDVRIGGNVTLGHAVNSGALFFTGAVNFGGVTRTVTTDSNVTIDGPVHNGGLTKDGAGTLTLAGMNTYAGGTTVNGGSLVALADDALGTGGVTLSGATLHIERGTTISNDIVLTAAADENVIRAAVAVDHLVIGGGGGGAGRDISGGGGAGGLLSNLVKPEGPLAVGSGAYEVVVGAGGAGGVDSGSSRPGKKGGDSSFAGIVAQGGGGGNAWQYLGSSGGSGGGGDGFTNRSGNPGAEGQGFPGGSGIGGTHYGGGGGGGAGQPGADATAGKAGGDGLQVDISGANDYYAGGGGGAGHRSSGSGELGPGGLGGGGAAGISAGVHGAPNTGSGGGASRSTGGTGGAGGSGVVIVRYRGDPVATGGAISVGTGSAAGYTLHTFTDVGAHTLEFGPIGATIAGTISGIGGFTLDTPGTLTLTSANTHSGQTRVIAGTLALGNALAVQNSTLHLAGGAVAFTAPGQPAYTLGGLSGAGAVNAGASPLVVGGNNENTGFTGNLTAAQLIKTGSGTLSLSGSNTLGGTTISGGTLAALSDGAIGTGAVELAAGALHVERGTTLSNDIVLTAAADENVIRAAVAVDYLVVGGGGGGGGRDSSGGGGAGGVLSNLVTTAMAPLPATSGSYDVNVGGGGAGGVNTTRGANGQPSSLDSIVALGGGAGAPYLAAASDGASGGGGGRETVVVGGAGTPGQGFPGGAGSNGANPAVDSGGGGGGAGGPGGDAVKGQRGGHGGTGLAVDITGADVYYAGGGGGTPHRATSGTLLGGHGGLGGGGAGLDEAHQPPSPGHPNTGGGGGAARSDLADYRTGGDGGSGIVIARYRGNPAATGGTISAGTGSASGYTLHTFTDAGSHSLDFGPIDLTISGTISGTGGFTWDTPGVLTLTRANTHSGQTRVTAGTLALENALAFQNSTLSLAGGSVAFNAPGATSYTLGGLAGTSSLDAGTNALLVGGNSERTIFAGNLTAAELTKTGSGSLSLAGSNTLGGTTISGGTVAALSDGALGTGDVTLAGATLHVERDTNISNNIVLNASAEENFLRGGVTMDYLVVSGGGGGAGRDVSGGGGAGGVLSNRVTPGMAALTLSSGEYDVIVGDGGNGGVNTARGDNGEASSFDSIVALGGGAGGPYNRPAASGASGGGSGRESTPGAGTPGQGFDGGEGSGNTTRDAGGGGGGAGGLGGSGLRDVGGGDGGPGLAVDITGELVHYGGGGGGTPHRIAPDLSAGSGGLGGGGDGAATTTTAGNPGLPNTGGGGGASRNATSTPDPLWIGGKGGSGVVIVRYWGDQVADGGLVTAGTGSAEGYTLHTFTDVGSHKLTFNDYSTNATISGNMTGTGGFTWDTPGMLSLTGTNTYSGDTRITAGTLALTGAGSIGNSATIDVHAGALFDVAGTNDPYALSGGQTLTGSGTVVGDLFLDSGSIVSPGASIGALHFQDRLTLDAGSEIRWEFNGTGIAGVDYDSMTGVGEDAALYLPDPDSGRIELSIFGPGASLQAGDTFTLFDGNVFDHNGTLFDLGADLTGLFNIAADYSGWWGTWEVSAGSLILTAVPEPAAWLMLLSAAAAGLLVRRRRWS